MLIITTSEGELVAEGHLVAAMLNMEHGATAFAPDGTKLPLPHAPWPIVTLPARTSGGLPVEAHYRPTSGIVFYSAGPTFDIRALVERLTLALAARGYDHLLDARVMGATPNLTMRLKGRVEARTVVAGEHAAEYRKRIGDLTEKLPARRFTWTNPERVSRELPHPISGSAAFTWTLMPVGALLSQKPKIKKLNRFNAIVASIFFDVANISKLHGQELFAVPTLAQMSVPPIPRFIERTITSKRDGSHSCPLDRILDLKVSPQHAAVLAIRKNGSMTLAPLSSAAMPNIRPLDALPAIPWPAADSNGPGAADSNKSGAADSNGPGAADSNGPGAADSNGPGADGKPGAGKIVHRGGYECVICEIPASGQVALLSDLHAPDMRADNLSWPRPEEYDYVSNWPSYGTPICVGAMYIICRFCMNRIQIPENMRETFRARLNVSEVPVRPAIAPPITDLVAWGKQRRNSNNTTEFNLLLYKHLAPVLNGTAEPINIGRTAFVVTLAPFVPQLAPALAKATLAKATLAKAPAKPTLAKAPTKPTLAKAPAKPTLAKLTPVAPKLAPVAPKSATAKRTVAPKAAPDAPNAPNAPSAPNAPNAPNTPTKIILVSMDMFDPHSSFTSHVVLERSMALNAPVIRARIAVEQ